MFVFDTGFMSGDEAAQQYKKRDNDLAMGFLNLNKEQQYQQNVMPDENAYWKSQYQLGTADNGNKLDIANDKDYQDLLHRNLFDTARNESTQLANNAMGLANDQYALNAGRDVFRTGVDQQVLQQEQTQALWNNFNNLMQKESLRDTFSKTLGNVPFDQSVQLAQDIFGKDNILGRTADGTYFIYNLKTDTSTKLQDFTQQYALDTASSLANMRARLGGYLTPTLNTATGKAGSGSGTGASSVDSQQKLDFEIQRENNKNAMDLLDMLIKANQENAKAGGKGETSLADFQVMSARMGVAGQTMYEAAKNNPALLRIGVDQSTKQAKTYTVQELQSLLAQFGYKPISVAMGGGTADTLNNVAVRDPAWNNYELNANGVPLYNPSTGGYTLKSNAPATPASQATSATQAPATPPANLNVGGTTAQVDTPPKTLAVGGDPNATKETTPPKTLAVGGDPNATKEATPPANLPVGGEKKDELDKGRVLPVGGQTSDPITETNIVKVQQDLDDLYAEQKANPKLGDKHKEAIKNIEDKFNAMTDGLSPATVAVISGKEVFDTKGDTNLQRLIAGAINPLRKALKERETHRLDLIAISSRLPAAEQAAKIASDNREKFYESLRKSNWKSKDRKALEDEVNYQYGTALNHAHDILLEVRRQTQAYEKANEAVKNNAAFYENFVSTYKLKPTPIGGKK